MNTELQPTKRASTTTSECTVRTEGDSGRWGQPISTENERIARGEAGGGHGGGGYPLANSIVVRKKSVVYSVVYSEVVKKPLEAWKIALPSRLV